MSDVTAAAPSYERFVAIGDSTTEGLVDPHPGGGFRGWADRFAELLADRNPDLLYANLAIRGRKLPQIRGEQLEAALAMEPDLVSVLGGVNDILRPKVDFEARVGDLDAIVAELRAGGADVVLVGYPDLTVAINLASDRLLARIRRFNVVIREIARNRGAILVDLERDTIRHPSMLAVDRLHASPLGHERMAVLAAAAVGVADVDELWQRRLPEPPERRLPARIAHESWWLGRYLAPWVVRRIRGISSGDGIDPKRPALAPVTTVGP